MVSAWSGEDRVLTRWWMQNGLVASCEFPVASGGELGYVCLSRVRGFFHPYSESKK